MWILGNYAIEQVDLDADEREKMDETYCGSYSGKYFS